MNNLQEGVKHNVVHKGAREKSPRAVSNISIKIKDSDSRNKLMHNETINMDEHEPNQKTVQNPWNTKVDVQTLQGINESPGPSLNESTSSPQKSLSPMTHFITNGESLQLLPISPRSNKKKDELQTYTQGLYVSLENKNINYAGAINLSSKLNLDQYKQQNLIKLAPTSVFQAEFQPAKLPSPIFSPTQSNASSPRMSDQGNQVINMEGQVFRGVHPQQLKSIKKEQEIKTLKQIALEVEDQYKSRRKPTMLNFPGFVQIQLAGQLKNFDAHLSGTTVSIMHKPLNVYRQKIKKIQDSQIKSNRDIQKLLEKRADEEVKSGRTSVLQKQASQPIVDNDYDFHGRETLQHFMNDWADKTQQKFTVPIIKESLIETGEQGLHDQGSQIKLQTADSENYLTYSQNQQQSPPAIVSGIKYTGSQLTFYEDSKGVKQQKKLNHIQNNKPEINGKQKRQSPVQLQKMNILQQLELSEQAYMVRFPVNQLSPSPKQIKMKIRNAKFGLQQFTSQHAKQTQESMQRFMKFIQKEQLNGTLPLIQQPSNVVLSPIPRVNVGFNTFEHRNKSISDQRGVAAHHSKVMTVKQAQLNLDMIEPLRAKPASGLLIKHPLQSYQVAPQQYKPMLVQDSVQPQTAQQPPTPKQSANNHQQLQTTYQSLPMTEIVSKQHTLYNDSSMPSTKNIKKDISAEELHDQTRWADPQLDRVVMKQTNEGVVTMRTYKVEEDQNFEVRLDTQGTLSVMNNTKEGFSKITKKTKPPEKFQITTFKLQDLSTTGKVKKLNKHTLKKKYTSLNQNENQQIVTEMHKTQQDLVSNASVLDQIMQLQESVYQQTINNRGGPSMQKGAIEIGDRLDDRSTLSPTELGFIQGPSYAPVVSGIEAKTTTDLRIKPLQQNPNRPSIQQTTSIYPLDVPSNFKKNEGLRKKITIDRNKNQDANKYSPKNPFETHKSTFQDRRSVHETQKNQNQSESYDFNLRETKKEKFLNTSLGKNSKWKETTRQGSFTHENGTVTPSPDQQLQDAYHYKIKRNSNPFVNHTNLLEVAQRFANKSTRNAPQSYHSEHTYQNAQNNSQYNSSYKYETATKEFRKLKIIDQTEKPTQLEIGGEGSPMLSLLPPLMTREISPRYKSSIEKKNKAIKQMQGAANPEQTQSQLNKKNQLLQSSKEDQVQQSNQLSNSQHKSPSGITLIGAGAFEIARSGSVSQKSQGQDDGLQSRLSTSRRVVIENTQTMKMNKNLSIEQISVLINNQSINEIGDRKGQEQSNNKFDLTKTLNSPSEMNLPGDSYESLNRSKTDIQSELITHLTKQFHKDVVVKQEFNPMNQAQAYHRRQLNVDGTWKAKAGKLGDKNFLEYINPKHFQNPLDSKTNFGLQTINPDRLLLMSNMHSVPTQVSPTQRRRSPKIHKDMSLVGQRITVNPPLPKQTDKNTEIKKQYEHKLEYFQVVEDLPPQTQHPTQSSATNQPVTANIKSKMEFRFTSPQNLRKPIETKPFTKIIASSQMSMNSNSEGEFNQTVSPKLNFQNSDEFLSTALLRYSPSSKLSKGQFGGKVKQPKTSRKQDKQVQSQSDVSQ